jgi:hypothetical protein
MGEVRDGLHIALGRDEISVQARGVLGNWGRGATARFAATSKPTSAFGDYSQLGKKKKEKKKKKKKKKTKR